MNNSATSLSIRIFSSFCRRRFVISLNPRPAIASQSLAPPTPRLHEPIWASSAFFCVFRAFRGQNESARCQPSRRLALRPLRSLREGPPHHLYPFTGGTLGGKVLLDSLTWLARVTETAHGDDRRVRISTLNFEQRTPHSLPSSQTGEIKPNQS
jgi:hypothetical protein